MYNADNLPPDTLIVHVLRGHINEGVKSDCSDCAVGLALQEQYSLDYPHWWSITTAVFVNYCGTLKRWAMTQELLDYIMDFDAGRHVEPRTFVLETVPV